MNEQTPHADQPHADQPHADQQTPHAVEKHSRWPGWIWAVPIAVFAIVAYLAIQQFTQRGPSITVTFPTGGGIKADDTKVKYEEMEVGVVEGVTFQKDLRHVDVTLRLHADMAGHLGKGTQFWIAGASPSLSNLSSIKAVITGPYIGMAPQPGDAQDHYDGLSQAPVAVNGVAGTSFRLQAKELGTVSRDSPVYYRDLAVGNVVDTQLDPDGKDFRIDVFVRAPFDHLVHENTKFWNASAVQVSMEGSGPRLQLQSVPALFQGALGFETPSGAAAGPPAKDGASFPLYDSKDAAENAPDGRSVTYRVLFHAAEAGGLQSGAAVRLADKRVGTVKDTSLRYDESKGELEEPATITIEPDRIALADGEGWKADPRPQMNALLDRLIAQGLRARLAKSPPVVGGTAVSLEFVPKAAPASLGPGPVPEIPTGPASDMNAVMASVSDVAAKIDAIPIDQIASDVHAATQRLAAISNSPKLTESLDHLDKSLANIEQVTHEANAQVGPILVELRRVTTEAKSTVAAARNLISHNALTSTQPGTASLGDTLYELSRAARSLRELADYLDRHPEALLQGKGG